MRIDKLWIKEYKNLKDVLIDFDEDSWVTILLGWNGTGKSNVLEAISELFRDLILATDKAKSTKTKKLDTPLFAYRIEYERSGNLVSIDADPERKKDKYIFHVYSQEETENGKTEPINIQKVGKKIPSTSFVRQGDDYLPKFVFGYYSGDSKRMDEVYQPYRSWFYRKQLSSSEPLLSRMLYALPLHSQFVLLAFVLQQDDVIKELLDEQLGIDPVEGIESVLFVLKQPPWYNPRNPAEDGDHRVWNARGVVKEFLARLYDISLAPIKLQGNVEKSIWGNKSGKRELLYLFVKNIDSLRELIGDYSSRTFFSELESTFISDLIQEIRIKVKLKKNDGSVVFKELSEGEQQLLTVLGLLRFTAQEESLFLLDEPDTHLNPAWGVKYLEYLRKFIRSDAVDEKSTHVILTTHNPLSIADLTKDQVQIMKRDMKDLSIEIVPPLDDPRGMGFAGILTSDMFDLKTSLDNYTISMLDEKRYLVNKEEALTEDEQARLKGITEELEEYGFRQEVRDPLYKEYLKARSEHEKKLGEVRRINQSDSKISSDDAVVLIKSMMKDRWEL